MDFRTWILSSYTLDDFADVPPNVMMAAAAFCRLLRTRFGDYDTQHVRIVPYTHVSSRDRPTHPHVVCVIYEMIYEEAEKVQLGYPKYKREYEELKRIESQQNVMFECNTHWATSVWCRKDDHGPPQN